MTGSTIMITGANRGIGLELTRQFSADGWQVLACCRNPQDAGELQALASGNSSIETHALDVTDYAQLAALARRLEDRPIDILLSNAGIYGPNGVGFGDIDAGEWRRLLWSSGFISNSAGCCFGEWS